ncbi:MAG: hypothetical protein WAO91_06135 [Candidatus Nitrosotenuis sp.]
MQYDEISKNILRRMYNDNRIGARHLGLEDLKHGVPSHLKGDVDKQLKKLVKANLILHHPTSYGMQYSLNPHMIHEIRAIIQ